MLQLWKDDVNLLDSNGLSAMDYAAMGQLGAHNLSSGEPYDPDNWSKCREILQQRGVVHSVGWLVDNPHAPPILQKIDADRRASDRGADSPPAPAPSVRNPCSPR